MRDQDQRERKGVYLRKGSKAYQMEYYAPDGERIQRSTGTKNEREAMSLRAAELRAIRNGTWVHPDLRNGNASPSRSSNFADQWEEWLNGRADVKTLEIDKRDGIKHILPFFGKRQVDDITAADLKAFFALMRGKAKNKKGEKYAANTIRGVSARLTTFFGELERDEKILRSPFSRLKTNERPRAPKRQVMQKRVRFFSVEEVTGLISDSSVDLIDRVSYALQFFTGTRYGESAGFRWLKWERPADILHITEQYDGEPLKGPRGEPGPDRMAPVHSELRRILEEWERDGFPALIGRAPRPDDFIIPGLVEGSRRPHCLDPRRPRALRTSQERLSANLTRLGFAPGGHTHGFRRAMKTIAVKNRAQEVWIERVVHNASGDVAAGYLQTEIEAMREAIECIPVRRREASNVVALDAYRQKNDEESRDSRRDSASETAQNAGVLSSRANRAGSCGEQDNARNVGDRAQSGISAPGSQIAEKPQVSCDAMQAVTLSQRHPRRVTSYACRWSGYGERASRLYARAVHEIAHNGAVAIADLQIRTAT